MIIMIGPRREAPFANGWSC